MNINWVPWLVLGFEYQLHIGTCSRGVLATIDHDLEISQPGEIHGLSWTRFFCECTWAHDTSSWWQTLQLPQKNSKKGSERKVCLKTNYNSVCWPSIRPAVQWKGHCQPSVTSWSALPWSSNFRNGSVDLTKLANDASEKFEFWSKPNSFDLGDLLDWEASWMLFSEEMRIVVSCCTFLGGISRHFTYLEMGWVKLPINQYSRCSETFLFAWSATSQITRARPRQPGIVNKRPWAIRAHVNCRSSLTMLQS